YSAFSTLPPYVILLASAGPGPGFMGRVSAGNLAVSHPFIASRSRSGTRDRIVGSGLFIPRYGCLFSRLSGQHPDSACPVRRRKRAGDFLRGGSGADGAAVA